MKKLYKNTVLAFIIAVTLIVPSAQARASTVMLDYVAFGDSVASGVRGAVKEAGSDFGYTDLIAAQLKEAGMLGSFSEIFCASGMTAKLLASNTAVLNDRTSSEYRLVKNAEISTLDIGANDLLAPIYAYMSSLSNGETPEMDKLGEILSYIGESVNDGVTAPGVQKNIETILQNILNANPEIKIYVMGYYNPLPVASALTGVDLDTPLKTLNSYIQKAIAAVSAENSGASITYIDTMTVMASDPASYLVMTDIHPTEAGYRAIAAEFWKQIGLLVPSAVSASPTKSGVLVNGNPVAFSSYNIDGSNYFKLRDIAMALSGSSKRFGVDWDGKSISLSSGSLYKPVGGELAIPEDNTETDVLPTLSCVFLDGKGLSLTAYNINGSNYFKLRDLSSAIDFGVAWDPVTGTISIDTSKSYAA
ncbi:MAG: SGNH/GDSL hydrolase family protein [Oscillospiraceae bacterium]|nr:SGNH/GDSL hydrolase family protein [Oscillospiraceae bacterium]